MVIFIATAVNIIHFSLAIWAVVLLSIPLCCRGQQEQQHQQQQQQPYVVMMQAPTGADGAAPAFIMMPTNAGQMPIHPSVNPGQIPIYAGQMPVNLEQLSVQTGQ